MKRIICFCLISVICLFAFIGCAVKNSGKNVEVAIVNQIDGTTISETLSLPDSSPAGEYIRQLCNKKDIVTKGVDEGYIYAVGENENSDIYAWMFYVNGTLSEVGVNDYIPADGDKIELIYLDWTQLSFE